MTTPNKFKVEFSAEDKTAIENAIKVLNEIFKSRLINLSPNEKKGLLKMGNKSLGFVNQNLMYARQKPDWVPSYLDMTEWETDLNSWNELAPYQAQLQELQSLVSDTISLCGNEAYRQSLTYYNSVKQAAKDNVNGARTVYENLSKHYNHPRRKADEVLVEELTK